MDLTIFCRDRPDLDNSDLHEPIGELDVVPYELESGDDHDDGEPFSQLDPWEGEIKWRVSFHCSHHDAATCLGYARIIAEKARGAVWDPADDRLTWYWWDRNAHEIRARAFTKTPSTHQLARWLRQIAHLQPQAILGEVATILVPHLDGFAESDDKVEILLLLCAPVLDNDDRRLLEDAILAMPPIGPSGVALRHQQATIGYTRDYAWAARQALPATRDEVRTLWALAMQRGPERELVKRVLLHPPGDIARWIAECALDDARAGAGELLFEIPAMNETYDRAPEFRARDAFARCGPLAASLAAGWTRAETYGSITEELLDKRRRAGELFVPLPADIEKLVRDGRVKHAAAIYARRFGLAVELALRVVNR